VFDNSSISVLDLKRAIVQKTKLDKSPDSFDLQLKDAQSGEGTWSSVFYYCLCLFSLFFARSQGIVSRCEFRSFIHVVSTFHGLIASFFLFLVVLVRESACFCPFKFRGEAYDSIDSFVGCFDLYFVAFSIRRCWTNTQLGWNLPLCVPFSNAEQSHTTGSSFFICSFLC
jgi:hypothetical protein